MEDISALIASNIEYTEQTVFTSRKGKKNQSRTAGKKEKKYSMSSWFYSGGHTRMNHYFYSFLRNN